MPVRDRGPLARLELAASSAYRSRPASPGWARVGQRRARVQPHDAQVHAGWRSIAARTARSGRRRRRAAAPARARRRACPRARGRRPARAARPAGRPRRRGPAARPRTAAARTRPRSARSAPPCPRRSPPTTRTASGWRWASSARRSLVDLVGLGQHQQPRRLVGGDLDQDVLDRAGHLRRAPPRRTEASTTCRIRSARRVSSSVAPNASTSWWGSLRMKPTVSVSR